MFNSSRSTTWKALIGGVLLSAACKNTEIQDEETSSVREFPSDKQIDFRITPSISCDTEDLGDKMVSVIDPKSGQTVKLEYKSSEDVDYLQKGWEDRIGASWNFFDQQSLGYPSNVMHMTVVDIRNVGGKPHYHYYSNGTYNQVNQNLSATKFIGASMSVHRLRQESGGKIGADVRFNTRVLASDLDIIGQASDNSYAAGVKNIGGHQNADMMLERWLVAGPRKTRGGANTLDTFNENWGAAKDYCGKSFPANQFESLDGNVSLTINRPADERNYRADAGYTGNFISGLTFVEWMKRLGVNFRDPDTMPKLFDYRASVPNPTTLKSLPSSLNKRDLEILLYGTAAYNDQEFLARKLDGSDCGGPISAKYNSFPTGSKLPRGGMMWDGLRDWPHKAGGSKNLTNLFGNNWRILGKGGSSGKSGREAVIGYMCFPKIVKQGKTVFPGRELAVYLHFSNGDKKYSGHNYTHVHNAAGKVFDTFVPGLKEGSPKNM